MEEGGRHQNRKKSVLQLVIKKTTNTYWEKFAFSSIQYLHVMRLQSELSDHKGKQPEERPILLLLSSINNRWELLLLYPSFM